MNIGCVYKVNDRTTISNTEILQCHTFTKCIVCTIIFAGYSIWDFCSPPESFQVRSCTGIGSIDLDDAEQKQQMYSGCTSLGPNLTKEDIASGTAPESPTLEADTRKLGHSRWSNLNYASTARQPA